ncbi:CAP domain-containing protein [Eubacterium sp. 1001713B170207_170306_E7]|uniref:CAP domain-containing protein n=1 Tax=Eubacterium sp. 1001713B170207_170306_E7 TaxID=2787097 RepID=UPI00189AFBC6|nr:CAP domain-containing protein [Eubacterium sp. 1001713B170207_170306_E7]
MKNNNEVSSVIKSAKKAAIGAGVVTGVAAFSMLPGGQVARAEELLADPANLEMVVTEEVQQEVNNVSSEELAAANEIIVNSAEDSSMDVDTADAEDTYTEDPFSDEDYSEPEEVGNDEDVSYTEDTGYTEDDSYIEGADSEEELTDGSNAAADEENAESTRDVSDVDVSTDQSAENDLSHELVQPPTDELTDESIVNKDDGLSADKTDSEQIQDEKADTEVKENTETPTVTEDIIDKDEIKNKEENGEGNMIVDSNVQNTTVQDAQIEAAQNTQQFMTAAIQTAQNYGQSLTQKDIVDLYNKYVSPYHDASKENDLFAMIQETYNADGSLSQQSQEAALGLINFFRALCGLGEVTVSQDDNKYAQAGSDYLADTNFESGNPHNAADGSGNADAIKGLHSSNISMGSQGYSIYDLLLMQFGDDDDQNGTSLGHRRWLLDPDLKTVGFAASKGTNWKYFVLTYTAVDNPDRENVAFPNDGFFPIEALISSSTMYGAPFNVSLGSDYKVTSPSGMKVTITKDDGTTTEFNYVSSSSNPDMDANWWTVNTGGYGSGSAIIINPSYNWLGDYQALAGHSFTVAITGLTDKAGNPATITYTINFFSLQQAVKEQAADREAAQKVTDQINGIKPTDELTYNDYDSVKGIESAYNGLTTSQKDYVAQNSVQKLNEAVQKVTELKATHEADQKAADVVKAAINQIPADVTLEAEGTVTSARDKYDLLTQDQKNLVDNYQKLTDAETTIAALKKEQAENQAAAQKVTDLINGLPDNITLENKAAVEDARAAYDALNDKAEAMVSSQTVSKLTSAESKIVQLEKEANDLKEASKVINQINALPGVNDIELEDESEITAARTAYDGLTDDQKAIVEKEGAVKTLTNAEKKLAEVKLQHMQDEEAVKTVTDAIGKLPDTDALQMSDETAVNDASNLYNAMTDTQKDMMDQAVVQKLEDAKAQITKLIAQHKIDVEAAKTVTDQINSLPSVVDRNAEQAVTEASKAYEGLTDTQRALVDPAAVNKLEAAVKVIDNIHTADAVTNQIQELPAVDNLTLENRDAVKAAVRAYNALTDEQKQYIDANTKAALDSLVHQIDVLDVENVTNIINGLKDLDDLTLEDKEAVQRASDAYDALSPEARAMMDQEVYNKLDQAEDKITDLEDEQAADQVETVVGALKNPGELTLEDKGAVYAARDMYNALSENAKSKLDPAMVQKLADLVKQMDQLVADHEAEQNPGQDGNGGTGNVNDGSNGGVGGSTTGTGTVVDQNGADNGTNGPNTGISQTSSTGLIASILALFGIGGAGLFARRKRKANK